MIQMNKNQIRSLTILQYNNNDVIAISCTSM